MKPLTRRSFATGLGVAVASVPALALPVRATEGGDAELKRLWKLYVDQWAECGRMNRIYNDVEEKIGKETPPRWRLHWHGGHFIAYDTGKPISLPVPAGTSYEQALAMQADFQAKVQRADRNAKRRYRWAAARRADEAASDRLKEIEFDILKTPAEGIQGLGIKLAVAKHDMNLEGYRSLDDAQFNPIAQAAFAAVESFAHLTGIDYAAQIERW